MPIAVDPSGGPRSICSRRGGAAAVIASVVLLAACGHGNAQGGKGEPPRPAQVGYVVVQSTSVPIEEDLPGRVTAFQISEVRPQVAGVVLRRLFTEGSIVRQGQTLYQIDPSLYRAATAQATANLQSARAAATAAAAHAARYRPLAQQGWVSQQDYADVVALARQSEAAVAQNEAGLHSTQINLRYTRVPAPITGRIGLSTVTQGALVTADQAAPLATITRLDPINVDIQQSATDLLALRRSLAQGGAAPASAQVRLTLADGSDYGLTGTIQFSEVIVDSQTGAVTLRARFPNPQGILLPGMYVNARFAQAIDTSAFLVPQQALSRDPRGNATIWVVGSGNRAVQRTVVTGRTEGPYWVVTQGLAAGEKVITQGAANLRDGAQIRPVPASAPQRLRPPPGGPARGR